MKFKNFIQRETVGGDLQKPLSEDPLCVSVAVRVHAQFSSHPDKQASIS